MLKQLHVSAIYSLLQAGHRTINKQNIISYILSYLLFFVQAYLFVYFAVALRPNAGHGLFVLEISRSHTTTHNIR